MLPEFSCLGADVGQSLNRHGLIPMRPAEGTYAKLMPCFFWNTESMLLCARVEEVFCKNKMAIIMMLTIGVASYTGLQSTSQDR